MKIDLREESISRRTLPRPVPGGTDGSACPLPSLVRAAPGLNEATELRVELRHRRTESDAM